MVHQPQYRASMDLTTVVAASGTTSHMWSPDHFTMDRPNWRPRLVRRGCCSTWSTTNPTSSLCCVRLDCHPVFGIYPSARFDHSAANQTRNWGHVRCSRFFSGHHQRSGRHSDCRCRCFLQIPHLYDYAQMATNPIDAYTCSHCWTRGWLSNRDSCATYH